MGWRQAGVTGATTSAVEADAVEDLYAEGRDLSFTTGQELARHRSNLVRHSGWRTAGESQPQSHERRAVR